MRKLQEKILLKNPKNIWRLHNMLLNNERITEKNPRGNKKKLPRQMTMKTSFQSLWNTAKAVLRGKFIAIQSYFSKQEKSQTTNFIPKATRERSVSKI